MLEDIKKQLQGIVDQYKVVSKEKAVYFKADPNKRWSINEFKEEGKQVVVDKSQLKADELKFFQDYEKIAQAYINRMTGIYEGKNANDVKQGKTPQHKLPVKVTGKMLADAALKTYIKYGHDIDKVVPVELALAQAQGESHFGTVTPRKGSEVSPFNVGVYDSHDAGFLNQIKDAQEGTEMYYDLMAEDYLSNKTPEQLVQNFTNEKNQRYASDKGYEQLLAQIKSTVQSVASKNGLSLPDKSGLKDDKKTFQDGVPVEGTGGNTTPPNNNNTTPPNNNNNTTPPVQPSKTISGSVGDGGVNKPEDVLLVKTLLNKHGAGLDPNNPNVAEKTIAAIKDFQSKVVKLSKPDGRIDVGGKTWQALSGGGSSNTGGNTTPPNNNNTTPPNNNSTKPDPQTLPGQDNKLPDGASTWDVHTNNRIATIDGRVKGAAIAFVNNTQKELGIKLRVTSGFRNLAEQDALFAKGGVTQARGGQSYHNFGLAIDVCIITPQGKADFNITPQIAAIAKKLGWEWGGDWKGFVDRPHFQMTFGKSEREYCIQMYPERAKQLGYIKTVPPNNGGNNPQPNNGGNNPQPNNQPITPNNPIKGSVGDGGQNTPGDVITVQKLFNTKYKLGLPENGIADPKLGSAIRQFQEKVVKLSKPDGRIDAGGRTWKALTGEGSNTNPNPTPTPTPNPNPTPPNPNGKEQTVGGAETAEEQKLQEFMQAMSDIQVQINPGKSPAQIVGVRPPYHINAGKRAAAAAQARKDNPKVASIISKIGLGGAAGDGKATPPQMKKFLEDCIAQGLVPASQLNAKGLRDFLAKYGVSTDCSGLAIQALNFIHDGDLDRESSDKEGIMNTQMMTGEANKTKNGGTGKFKDVSAPTGLKAGDFMLNYHEKGTDTYHVRVIIDVDANPDGSIEFTTVESAGGVMTAQGDGVGQRRWKFPNGGKFENLQISKKNDGVFSLAGKSDQAYRYVRHKSLQ